MQFHPMSFHQPQILPTIPVIGLNQPALIATPQSNLTNNENYRLLNAATKDSKVVYNVITPGGINKTKSKETNYEVIIKSRK